MKKIGKFLKIGCIATFLFGFFSFLNPMRTSALTDILIKDGGEQLDDFAFYKHKTTPSLARSHRIEMMKMQNSNKFVYCIQPGTSVYDEYSYDGYMSDYEVVANLSPEQWRMISLIAYYGFEYVDKEANIDHTASKWYSVTQMLIWQYATTEFEIYFSKSIRNERIEKYTEETAEVLRLVEEHSKKPNLGNNIVAYLGSNLVINDSNNVLKGYKIISSNNVNATIDGNQLKITPNSKGDFSITFQKEFNKYDGLPIVYTNATSQNVMAKGNLDPNSFMITGTVKTGGLELKKYDSINKSCTPQKDGSLSGSVYKLYKEDGTFVQDLIIGTDCSASADNLDVGKYYVLESKAGIRYELDTEKHYFTLSAENPHASLTVYDKPIFGNLKLKKYDSITKKCTPQKDGSLSGAIYKLYKSDGTFIQDLEINSNCEATANNLDIGKYYIKESKAGIRYELDLTQHDFEISLNQLNAELTVYEKPVFGELHLRKVDATTNTCVSQKNSSLANAVYKLYKETGEFVQDLVINSECEASASNLDVGRYYIQESQSGLHYEIDPEKYYFDITASKMVMELTVKDVPMFGQVSIKKHDSQTNSCNARGAATLAGAVYGIYDEENNLVTKLTIDTNCFAESEKNLVIGNYYLKELTAPRGYKLDTEKHFFSITEDNYKTEYEITLTDKVYTTTLVINKTYLLENGVKAEVGATFDIISKTTGKVVATITIDESATGSVELPYDNYIIRQTKTKSGYKKSEDIDFKVDENVQEKEYVTLMNEPYLARVKVKKVDSKGKDIPMKGIRFKIFDITNNKYICQTISYPTQMNVCEFETDEKGEFITPKELYPGNYRLEEVDQVLNGYLWNPNGLEFTIDENTKTVTDKDLGEILNMVFENEEVTGKIEIQKTGEQVVIENGEFTYVDIPLPNITFGLYDDESNLIDTYTTDERGRIVIEDLKLGKYVLKELKTDDKYVLDEKEYNIELKYKDQYTAVITETFTLKNYLKKGNLDFSKTDLVTGEEIPNVKIEVYTENDELIYSGITDEEGKITIEELSVGKYYILEKEAATGYLITDEKVFFEIKENGEIVKAEMKDKPITGKLEFTKTDFVTGEVIPNTVIEIYTENDELIYTGKTDEIGKITIEELRYGKYYILEKEAATGYLITDEKVLFEIKENDEIVKAEMKDKPITGKLEFTKTDLSTSEALPNTLIEIYTDKGKLVFSGRTDENGDITIQELVYGKYCLYETEAPEGYVLNEEPLCFEITKDGEIIKAKMKDERIKGNMKFYKTDENGNPLKGVTIQLSKEDGTEIGEYITDENGIVYVENLEYGNYFITEIATIEGYDLSDEIISFSIKDNEVTLELNMVNVHLPQTGLKDYEKMIGNMLLLIGSILLLITMKKKIKKTN